MNIMPDFKAIILAAGPGTRMKSSLPKVLHKLSGKPMLALVMDSIIKAGVDDIIAVVPSCHKPLKETFEGKIAIAVQKHPKGSGHALLQCRQKASNIENILVINGDMPLIEAKTLSDLMKQHKSSKADLTLLTGKVTDPRDFGRIVRNDEGQVINVVEESEADAAQLHINEVNAGVYCFKTSWLWAALESLKPSKSGEFFLTDLISFAESINLTIESINTDYQEIMGVNNKSDLAKAEMILRTATCESLMETGVRIIDPDTTYIDLEVLVGPDTVIFPNTHIRGSTTISSNCEIGPNCEITNSSIGSSCMIRSSTIESTTIHDNVSIGPYSHIREGSVLNEDVSIGNYVEIKNSTLGQGTKSGHHCYLGDSDIGSNVNIGAGTITCNYDGKQKHRTTIRDNAFIGSDTKLVAPVTIGKQSITGAGSIVTKDIPDFAKGVGSPARILKEGRSS